MAEVTPPRTIALESFPVLSLDETYAGFLEVKDQEAAGSFAGLVVVENLVAGKQSKDIEIPEGYTGPQTLKGVVDKLIRVLGLRETEKPIDTKVTMTMLAIAMGIAHVPDAETDPIGNQKRISGDTLAIVRHAATGVTQDVIVETTEYAHWRIRTELKAAREMLGLDTKTQIILNQMQQDVIEIENYVPPIGLV